MSFGGHVNDMINRVKQNAALKNARKGKFKGGNDYSHVKITKTEYDFPSVSKGQMENIKNNIRRKSKLEQKKQLFLSVIIALFVIFIFILFNSCEMKPNNQLLEIWKKEIVETEKQFEINVNEIGMQKAFLLFSDSNAVLLRNNEIIKGKNEIDAFFNTNISENKNVKLTWKPDFVEVSNSGDLGYTYGKYTYSFIDSLGIQQKNEGVFHTVWKRQLDNTWKFVWD